MVRMMVVLVVGFALLGASSEASAQEFKYVGVKKCRSCHKKELMGNQIAKWQEMKHSKAFESLKSEDAVKIAKEKGLAVPAHEAPECLKCHVTAYDVGPELIAKKPLSHSDGVQCESCHGPGSGYRKKKTMSDRDKAVAKGLWLPGEDEKICLECHNDESPTWDTTKYTLADGTTVAFDYEQAKEEIAHPIPEDVKGRYLEIEAQRKAEKKARGEADDEEDEEEDDE
jgi:cytochrome c peroxidase